MSDSTAISLIKEVSKRVDSLEQQVNNATEYGMSFWIPVTISLLAILISFLSYLSNQKQSKKNALSKIKSNIDLAKSQIETLTMELAPLKAKNNRTNEEEQELKIKLQVYDSVIERLLNGYEDGCDKFFKKQIIKQDFIDSYHSDIRSYVEEFPEKFTEPLTRFTNTLDYYNEYHKKVKA